MNRIALLLLSLLLAACAQVPESSPEVEPHSGHVELATFRARFEPATRKLAIEPVISSTASPLTSIGIDQDGMAGTGPAQSCELVTTDVTDYYPTDPLFTADVDLRHFMQQRNAAISNEATRSISNAFVQVSSLDCDPSPCVGSHNANNSDPSEFGLDATFGLWKYQGDYSDAPGVLGRSSPPDPSLQSSKGSHLWSFDNPDDATTIYTIKVWASLTYSDYAPSISGIDVSTFVDACDLGGSSASSVGFKAWTPSFPIAFYGTTLAAPSLSSSSQILQYKNGVLLVGGGFGPSIDNTCGPTTPRINAFWDNITYNAGTGKMCFVEVGSAPNRQMVFSWKHMKFNGGTGVDDLNFSAVITEGTDQIDFVYSQMDSSAQPDRAAGSSATIGANKTGGTCGSTFGGDCVCNDATEALSTTGNAYTFQPLP